MWSEVRARSPRHIIRAKAQSTELSKGCATHHAAQRARLLAPAQSSRKASAEPASANGMAPAQAPATEPREPPGKDKIAEEQNSAPNRRWDVAEIAQRGRGHMSSAFFRKPAGWRADVGKQRI